MKKINIKELLPILLLSVIHFFFFYSIIAPDYLGLIIEKPAVNPIYYIPPVITSLYFAIKHRSEKSKKEHFVKIMIPSIVTTVVPLFLLLSIANRINHIRCQDTGLCDGSSPYDYMSIVFLVSFFLLAVFRTTVSAVILIIINQLYKKFAHRNSKHKTPK